MPFIPVLGYTFHICWLDIVACLEVYIYVYVYIYSRVGGKLGIAEIPVAFDVFLL